MIVCIILRNGGQMARYIFLSIPSIFSVLKKLYLSLLVILLSIGVIDGYQ